MHWLGCYLVSKKKCFRFWYVFSFGLSFHNIRNRSKTWKLHVHSIVSNRLMREPPPRHDQFKMTKHTKYENRQYVTPLSQKYKAMRRVIQHKQTDQEEKAIKQNIYVYIYIHIYIHICIYIYSEVQFDDKYSPVREGE